MRVDHLVPLLAVRRCQRAFVWLHHQSIRGLGYGNADPNSNGEYRLLDELSKSWGAEPVIFDVGAAQGAWSNAVLARAPGARVFAIEPRPTAMPEAAIHVPVAFGAEQMTATLYGDGEMSSLTRRDLSDFTGLDTGEDLDASVLEVPVRRLDDFCSERGIDRIDLLKVDAEGHDLDVLVGAGEMLHPDKIGAIQFEFGGANIDSRTFFRDFRRLLDAAGFEVYRVVRDGWVPTVSSELGEIFHYVNMLALPAGSIHGARRRSAAGR